MFYCGLQSIARFISTRPTSTRIGWRVKENFPETFKSQREKIKMLFTDLGRSVLGETVPKVLSTAGGRRPRAALRPWAHCFSQYGPTQAGE